MEIENLWGDDSLFQNDMESTDNVYRIIEKQCEYLTKKTKGNVFGVFGEVKRDGAAYTMMKAFSEAIKGISGLSSIQETVDGLTTEGLINASDMYYEKEYAFEICTEKYRYRVFRIELSTIYPIKLYVDDGIIRNIKKELDKMGIPLASDNSIVIKSEMILTNVLKIILQDIKVRYIISELLKRAEAEKTLAEVPEKVIVCEGRKDEIIIQAVAKKINCNPMIVVADGKYNVPKVFDSIKGKNNISKILLVVDSDGDIEGTRNFIKEEIGEEGYKLAIIEDSIEGWFGPEIKGFNKLKLLQTIDSQIESMDFEKMRKKHESFNTLLDFINE